jgi:hypothetical protein
MNAEIPHCGREHDYSVELPRLRVADGGRLLKLSFARSPAMEWNQELFYDRGGVRGKCKGFSFGSRRRMLDRLNTVSVVSKMPEFVTMTLPDEVFHDDVGEFAKRAKTWLQTWLKRLARVCPGAAGFWRIEWKARKSGAHEGKIFPHFHLLVWGLPERESRLVAVQGTGGQVTQMRHESYVELPDYQLTLELLDRWDEASRKREDWTTRIESGTGRVFAGSPTFAHRASHLQSLCLAADATAGEGDSDVFAKAARCMAFQDWASLAWYHVVDSHNLDHLQAGVRVEHVRTWGGVMTYCAKYMAKADAEFMAEIAWGRSWGIFNREGVPWAKMLEIDLDNDEGILLRRIARRYWRGVSVSG